MDAHRGSRIGRGLVLVGATLLLAAVASAGGSHDARLRRDLAHPSAGGGVAGSPAELRERHRAALDGFAKERRRDARAEIRAELRDTARQPALRALEREGSLEALARFRTTARAEEERDALDARVERDWHALEAWSGQPLGPVTRRVLEESAIRLRHERTVRLRTTERRLELDTRLRPVERRLTPGTPSLPDLEPAPPERVAPR